MNRKRENVTRDGRPLRRYARRWKVERTMILDDGTELHPGDSLLALHLWNERMTALASHLGELGRSRILLDDFTYSLQLLAAALQAEVFSAAPAGIYAEFGFTEQDRSAERVFRRLGFTVRIKEDPGLRFWRRAFWENFYAWMLMWTYAPGTLKGKEMTKLKRIQVWISYTQFLDRFLFHTPA